MEVYDTAGSEDLYEIRSLCYPDATTFFLVYSVVRALYLQNVKTFWISEMLKGPYKKTPVIVCGNMLDLARKTASEYTSTARVKRMLEKESKSRKMVFRECSAYDEMWKTGENEGRIHDIFKKGVKMSLEYISEQALALTHDKCLII